MFDLSVIEDGVVHVRGKRIVAVGTRSDVPVPEGADVLAQNFRPGVMERLGFDEPSVRRRNPGITASSPVTRWYSASSMQT